MLYFFLLFFFYQVFVFLEPKTAADKTADGTMGAINCELDWDPDCCSDQFENNKAEEYDKQLGENCL